jgi:mannose-6-phosphate isomerase-like protein (cupin superfamily)
MQVTVIRKHEGIRRKAGQYYTILNKITKKHTAKVSLSLATRKGGSEKTASLRSDRIYFVLSGKMEIIADRKKLILNHGDAVLIPARTTYEVSGKFITVTINAPSFDMKNEKFYR